MSSFFVVNSNAVFLERCSIAVRMSHFRGRDFWWSLLLIVVYSVCGAFCIVDGKTQDSENAGEYLVWLFYKEGVPSGEFCRLCFTVFKLSFKKDYEHVSDLIEAFSDHAVFAACHDGYNKQTYNSFPN